MTNNVMQSKRNYHFQLCTMVKLVTVASYLSSVIAVGESEDNKRLTQSMIQPKMNGRPVVHGEEDEYSPFSDVAIKDFVETIESKVAYFTGKCSSDAPFEFFIGGK